MHAAELLGRDPAISEHANLGKARFRDLRAAGAFLVSAAWDGKTVSAVTLKSEKGAPARVANPWAPRAASVRIMPAGAAAHFTEREGILEFATAPGAVYAIEPTSR